MLMGNNSTIRFFMMFVVVAILIVAGSYLYKQFQKTKGIPGITNNTTKNSTSKAGLPSLPSSPSAKQTNQYVADVQKQAQDANNLTFTNCIANPAVFKVKEGDAFTIQNNDEKDIKIAISSNAIYNIPAKKTQQVKMTTEAAIYKYGCSYPAGGTANPQAGVIYVTK